MLEAALKFVRDHFGLATAFHDDQTKIYDRPVHRVPLPTIPRVDTIMVATLQSFADYITNNPDEIDDGFWVHVENPSRVVMLCNPNANRAREIPIICACEAQDLSGFERYQNADTFIPEVMAMAEKGDRLEFLSMLSTVSIESSEVLTDDGGGQTVKTNKGSSLRGWAKQKNPISLAPYRTFPELDQPLGNFFVRWDDTGRLRLIASPDLKWSVVAGRAVRAHLLALVGESWESRIFA